MVTKLGMTSGDVGNEVPPDASKLAKLPYIKTPETPPQQEVKLPYIVKTPEAIPPQTVKLPFIQSPDIKPPEIKKEPFMPSAPIEITKMPDIRPVEPPAQRPPEITPMPQVVPPETVKLPYISSGKPPTITKLPDITDAGKGKIVKLAAVPPEAGEGNKSGVVDNTDWRYWTNLRMEVGDYLPGEQPTNLYTPSQILAALIAAGAPAGVIAMFTSTHGRGGVFDLEASAQANKAITSVNTQLEGKTGVDAFNTAKSLGLIPNDAIYVPSPDGKGYTFTTPAQAKQYINDLVNAGVIKNLEGISRMLDTRDTNLFIVLQNLVADAKLKYTAYTVATQAAADFINPDGTIRLADAINSGIDTKTLLDLGLSQLDIDNARLQIQTQKQFAGKAIAPEIPMQVPSVVVPTPMLTSDTITRTIVTINSMPVSESARAYLLALFNKAVRTGSIEDYNNFSAAFKNVVGIKEYQSLNLQVNLENIADPQAKALLNDLWNTANETGDFSAFNDAWNNYASGQQLRIEQQVATMSPEFQTAYKAGGVAGLNKAIADYNARLVGVAPVISQQRLDELKNKAGSFINPDGTIRTLDALVAGALTNSEIKELTGTEIDTSKPIPWGQFVTSWIASNSQTVGDDKGVSVLGGTYYPGRKLTPEAIKAQSLSSTLAAYDRVFGEGEGKKALGRNAISAVADTVGIPVVSKILEPTEGIQTTNAGDWALSAAGIALLTASWWMPKLTANLPELSPIGKIEVPLSDGTKLNIWKGVKAGNQPLVGVSGGKLVLGTENIALPKAEELALPKVEGTPFEPRTGLETRVLAAPSAMAKMGISEAEIAKVQATLPEVKSFYGKPSPYLNESLVNTGTKTLNKAGVEAVLRQGVEDAKIVDSVKNYGSYSMRPQLSPEALAEWTNKYGRVPADIDVQLGKISQDEAIAFTDRLVDRINSVNGVEKGSRAFRSLDPNHPTLIEATDPVTGKSFHVVDIHFGGEVSTMPSSPQFGEQVYGLRKEAPLATVDIPGIGKVNIAGLSETGIGKTEQVLGWRIGEDGNIVLMPEGHRMKDYIDLYEIIKTFNGKEVADAWAETIGLDLEALAKAASDEAKNISWEFNPSKASNIASIGVPISPVVSIIGSNLQSAASSVPVGTSNGQLVVISKQVFTPSIKIPSTVSDVSKYLSDNSISISNPISLPNGVKAIGSQSSVTSKIADSPIVSELSPIIDSLKPSEVLGITSSGAYVKVDLNSGVSSPVSPVSEVVSPVVPIISPPSAPPPSIPFAPTISAPLPPYPTAVSPIIPPTTPTVSPVVISPQTPPSMPPPSIQPPSPPPSPSGYKPIIPPPVPPSKGEDKKRPLIPPPGAGTKLSEVIIEKKYPITWHQSKIFGWVTIYPPYEKESDIVVSKEAPKGAKNIRVSGVGTAYKTIQSLGGNADIILGINMGAQNIRIESPSSKPGKRGAIRFEKDGDKPQKLTLKGIRPI